MEGKQSISDKTDSYQNGRFLMEGHSTEVKETGVDRVNSDLKRAKNEPFITALETVELLKIPSSERRVMSVDLPFSWKINTLGQSVHEDTK
uniref:Uncharacterized protein n=1 Tax=Setaria digitata TaxID=48799 RepID=A0A915Q6W6_9BILA